MNGLHCIDVQDKKGNLSKPTPEVKYRRIGVVPPIDKRGDIRNSL